MKTFKNSKKAGISLVALVITIIVLIILTGAVIVTFMEGGIIDRAKESVFKNDMRTYQEILALKRAENQMEIALGEKEDVEINASTLEEIQAIIPEFKEEYEGLVVITKGELSIGERVTGDELSSSEELYATWLSDLGIGLSRLPKNALASYVKVGDYVDYMPEGNNVTSYLLEGSESGYFENANTYEVIDQTITRQNSIKWRVLKNDGRQVTLISETPIDTIGLGMKEGFLNGARVLDEIYAELYSGTKGSARNLKIEEINELLNLINIELSEVEKPCCYDTDGNQVIMEIEDTLGDFLDKVSYDISSWNMPDDNYINYPLHYLYNAEIFKANNEEAYKVLFRNLEDTNYLGSFWLSSECAYVHLRDVYGGFGIRCVYDSIIDMTTLGNNENYTQRDSKSGRPIVILNTDVEISNPTAKGDTPASAWKLK